MNKHHWVVVPGFMTLTLVLCARQPPTAPVANPITASEKGLHSFISGGVARAAEKMPETNYDFKPTPEVCTFGQLLGHIADAIYNFCSHALGVDDRVKSIEKTKTTKADPVSALKEAVAYCNQAFDSVTATWSPICE